ncbi:MAG: PAS-domain containing protein [Celeribacter sp.]|jgi:PAS domain-containing protein
MEFLAPLLAQLSDLLSGGASGSTPFLALCLVLTALLAAGGGLLILAQLRPGVRVDWTPLSNTTELVFLFDETRLRDASGPARALLALGPQRLAPWPRLLHILSSQFPDIEQQLAGLAAATRLTCTAADDDPAELRAQWCHGLVRLELIDRPRASQGEADAQDSFTRSALQGQADALRLTLDAAPMPIWRETIDGRVIWANRTYLNLARVPPDDDALPHLFDTLPRPPRDRDNAELIRRAPARPSPSADADAPPDDQLWFECHSRWQEDTVLTYALPAQQIVRAEASLREFVQTLTKTFAHLTTGLAIFDRHRRLAVFNPALTDLSALPPEFLSGRPTLTAFLDALREAQRIPEPRDYRSWRSAIAALEQDAEEGTYQETWSLPGGQTLRVTGRPHPDGALAFLFEDITSEIALTRRFRSELELGQSIADSLEEAIAVFSRTGLLLMSNEAHARLWDQDPGAMLAEIGANEVIGHWQSRCRPSPVWGELRDFLHSETERAEWDGDLRMRDGTALTCRFVPIAGGATLVTFQHTERLSARKLWAALPARTG